MSSSAVQAGVVLGAGKIRSAQVGQQKGSSREQRVGSCSSSFQMPLHYPRYTKAEYEKMPEWRLDCLLKEYGLPVTGDLDHKRKFAMGAFLWSDH